jgi:hypothetical protein
VLALLRVAVVPEQQEPDEELGDNQRLRQYEGMSDERTGLTATVRHEREESGDEAHGEQQESQDAVRR